MISPRHTIVTLASLGISIVVLLFFSFIMFHNAMVILIGLLLYGIYLFLVFTQVPDSSPKQSPTKLPGDEGIGNRVLELTQSLKIQETKWKSILDNMAEGVVVVDSNLHFVLFNRAAEEILGVGSTNISVQDWTKMYNVFTPDDHVPFPMERHPLVRGIRGLQTKDCIQHIHNPKKQAGVYIHVFGSPIKNERGTITGALAVFRDVTEEKRIDLAKSEFVSLASHQLRTPLTAISWYAESLLNGTITEAKERTTYLREIYEATRHMISLVDALLNTSRLELGTFSVSPQRLDLVKTMKEILHELQPHWEPKKLTIIEQYSHPSIELVADIDLVRIIFQNLLTNAMKYTHNGGTITMSLQKKETVTLSVADTGMGIPPENQAKIFTKLFRAENVKRENEEGTGLGLYVVKAILDYVGGSISFESMEKKGTTFFVTFPKDGMSAKSGNKKLHL